MERNEVTAALKRPISAPSEAATSLDERPAKRPHADNGDADDAQPTAPTSLSSLTATVPSPSPTLAVEAAAALSSMGHGVGTAEESDAVDATQNHAAGAAPPKKGRATAAPTDGKRKGRTASGGSGGLGELGVGAGRRTTRGAVPELKRQNDELTASTPVAPPEGWVKASPSALDDESGAPTSWEGWESRLCHERVPGYVISDLWQKVHDAIRDVTRDASGQPGDIPPTLSVGAPPERAQRLARELHATGTNGECGGGSCATLGRCVSYSSSHPYLLLRQALRGASRGYSPGTRRRGAVPYGPDDAGRLGDLAAAQLEGGRLRRGPARTAGRRPPPLEAVARRGQAGPRA